MPTINQSMKTSYLFYTGAGTHAPIPMRVPVLRMLVVPVLGHCPVWGQWASVHSILRGRLQSTIPHRGIESRFIFGRKIGQESIWLDAFPITISWPIRQCQTTELHIAILRSALVWAVWFHAQERRGGFWSIQAPPSTPADIQNLKL